MEYYNRLYIMLLIFGVLISSQYSLPKERDKAKGDGNIDDTETCPPQQNEQVVIHDNLRQGATMSSVKQYMAINHIYRYRHTYDASVALDGLTMMVQDSGKAIGQTFENMTASVTSAAAPLFYGMAEILNDTLSSMVANISSGMLFVKDGFNFAANTTQISAEKFSGMAYDTKMVIVENVFEIPTAVTSKFNDCMALIEEDMNMVQNVAKMGAEWFIVITFDAFAYARKATHGTMEGQGASGMLDMAASLLTMVLGMAMVLYVAHWLNTDGRQYHKVLLPNNHLSKELLLDNNHSKELLRMLRIGDMNQRSLVSLLKGMSGLKKRIRKLEGQVAGMKQVAEERQVAVMDRLDEGSALIKKMQEMDKEFRILNGYQ